jgi:glycosyltransferase involved in cell wall biosynthesis
MKIVIIVSQFPPQWFGGTEIGTYRIAEHLAKRGHEVHIITSLDEGMPEDSCEKGFNIHRILRIRIKFFGKLFFWAAIVRRIHKIDPDIVQAQNLDSGIPALISKKLLKLPYAVWGQGSDVYLPTWTIKLSSKTIIKNADSVFALTKNMKKVMQAIYNREITVIPTGIDIEDYADRSRGIEKETGKIILFVGRLNQVKGVQYLLRAMKIVYEALPYARLILVGDGEERKNLEYLSDTLGIRDCVNFIGAIPFERTYEISDYMDKADVFVLPSLSEGLGTVILEAMASGLPVVATRVGGIPDILEDGVNGYLVEPGDFQDMAKKITLLLENQTLRHQLSEQNRKKAEGYLWKNIVNHLERIYLEIKKPQK